MKKLVLIFAMLGLIFNVIGCKAKKAQDETEIVENADVEKIEAEDANFAGTESAVETGPVDESLQAALGETPQTDEVAAGALPEDTSIPSTDVVNTDPSLNTDVAATPALDETALGSDVAANSAASDAALMETPVSETPVEASIDTPSVDVAQNEPPTDSSLTPDTSMSGGVAEMDPTLDPSMAGLSETPVIDAPVTETPTEVAAGIGSSSNEPVVEASSKPVASGNALKKISETVPYKHGEGFVNAVYIARPKEKLADVSRTIYGMDKSKELKSINSFLKSRGPKGGDKIYYISPNRPTDSTRTVSFYEDTGMASSTYVAQKEENLRKVSKKLLGYDNAWKEVWTTNEIASKSKLAAGETIRYWKPAGEISTPTLAQNSGPAKIVDSPAQMPEQMPPPQEVAMNTPPPPADMAPPVDQPVAQELPPPPPPPADMAPPVDQQVAQELPPPPPQDMTPPPPPPQEVAAAPVAPQQTGGHNMEEEPTAEEGAMSSDTMMMTGVVAVLVAALALVLVRRNKKKKEADFASIEQNHVGT